MRSSKILLENHRCCHTTPTTPVFTGNVPNELEFNHIEILHDVWCAFSALTLLVGQQEGRPACKNWVVRYRRGYLSGARCKWFAYGARDATATPSSLAPVKSRFTFLVLAYPGCPGEKAVTWM